MQDLPYRFPIYDSVTKKITTTGRRLRALFFLVLISAVAKGVWDIVDKQNEKIEKQNFEKRIQENQSILEHKVASCDTVKTRMEIAMAKMGFEYNEATGRLESKIDMLKKFNDSLKKFSYSSPVLDIIPDANPIIRSSYRGTTDVVIFVVSEIMDNAIATNVVAGMTLVREKDDTLTIIQPEIVPFISDKNDILHKNKGSLFGWPLKIQEQFLKNSKWYTCLNVTYTDKNDKAQTSTY